MKYIPRKTRVRMELVKGVTIPDVLLGLLLGGVLILIILSNLQYRLYYAASWLAISVTLYLNIAEGQRMYTSIILIFRFFSFRKKFAKNPKKPFLPIQTLIPYEKIDGEVYLNYGEYYGMVIEIKPIEFFLQSPEKQESIIKAFGNALTRLNVDQTAQIIKVNKAMLYDKYILNDEKKYETLNKMCDKGEVSQQEVESRSKVFETRVSMMIDANENNRTFIDTYYIVVYDNDKGALESTCDGIINTLQNAIVPIKSHIVLGRDLSIFLKANYTKDFDERDTDNMSITSLYNWTMPDEVIFKTAYTKINGVNYRTFNIVDYPLNVNNAWGYQMFTMPNTKVVINISPIARHIAERQIDRAMMEMEAKMGYSNRASKKLEYETHVESLRALLVNIKNSNENLFNVNMFITCEDYLKKEMRALLKQSGFKYNEMFGRQVDAFVSSNVSRLDTVKDGKRGINTLSLAAVFPFISGALMDEAGFFIGRNDAYGDIFVDFFRRDSERLNSNMMIIGKSGGGKSFATKTLLTNMAADNSRIFILDPEQEYDILAANLYGKSLDVGSGVTGRINPFHITPSLQSEDGGMQNDYSAHLQFLEQFFRVILDGINSDAFEKVNSLVIEMYKEKNIDETTDIAALKPEDFPIFDDLYRLVKKRREEETDEYIKRIYQIIEIYVQKFATGGRNANIWNGPTSLETKENFVVFCFRSLLANQNNVLANAQMLLVLRYLNNEIIRNKDWNAKMGFTTEDPDRRKIIIAIDEAHVFIDEKFPIALNFMQNLAKRIRKYDGMQIVITQNIKDFVGSPAIAKQSTAIINASQFTLVFGLAPNDMTDMVELYRNAGGINEDEREAIITAQRGEAFFMTSPVNRTSVKIIAYDTVRRLFEKRSV